MSGVRVSRPLLKTEGFELISSNRSAFAQNYHGSWHIAFDGVWDRCHHRIRHSGVSKQEIFDFFWINVLSPAAKHIIDPAAEKIEAFCVPREDIARAQPSIDQLLLRDFRLVVIAQAHVRTANPALSEIRIFISIRIDELDLNLRSLCSDATTGHWTPVQWRAKRATSLRQSVALRCLNSR